MANAMGIMAAQRGIELATAMGDAYSQQNMAAMQSASIQSQMDEIELRNKKNIENIGRHSEKVISNQTAAFISGGVTMSGSAMSVVSDTLHSAAQAAYIKQRETDYDVGNLMMEKGAFDRMASNETLYLKMAASTIGAVAGAAQDKYKYGKASTRDRGTMAGVKGDYAVNTNNAEGLDAYA